MICTVPIALAALTAMAAAEAGLSLPRNVQTQEIRLRQPFPEDAIYGGLFAADLTGEGEYQFVVTSEGHVGAYKIGSGALWVWKGPIRLFPFAHHPGAITGDLDGKEGVEVAVFEQGGGITVLDGRTGKRKYEIAVEGEPVAMAIANLRGLGDRDIVLQYSLTRLSAIRGEDGGLIWETDEYKAIEHSPLRQADLDGDGLDEIAGAALIDHDGARMNDWTLDANHTSMDSIVIADVVPGYPLEVVLAEQRGPASHTDVVNPSAIVWRALNPWNWEDPDKVAAGDFDPERPGLEVFNRSSGGDGAAPRGDEEPFRHEQAPWVLDAEGNLIAKYYINDMKPDWWTGHGIEEISAVNWDGDARMELAAKERHKTGAAAIIDALTGAFRLVFPVEALRLYAADVTGDAREEIVALDKAGVIKVFTNTAPNPRPDLDSPWERNEYRRQKQNWGYYSP